MKATCIGLLVFFTCDIPEPPKPTAVVCPPVIEWPADLQKRAAAELKALPPGAALRKVVPLAIDQRDINRRCKAAAPPKK